MTKQETRKYIKEIKSSMQTDQIQTLSKCITKKLLQSREYKECSQIFCYVSFNQEVNTIPIIMDAFSDKKRVAIPKIIDNEMKFYIIHSLDELKSGYYGILEPDLDEITLIGREAKPDLYENTLMVMPGLAFDLDGNRVGYGKGYYDSYLIKYEKNKLVKIALAYDFQILDKIPAEINDKKADKIITEERMISRSE